MHVIQVILKICPKGADDDCQVGKHGKWILLSHENPERCHDHFKECCVVVTQARGTPQQKQVTGRGLLKQDKGMAGVSRKNTEDKGGGGSHTPFLKTLIIYVINHDL
jgi:hypothetical protein